MTKIYTLNPANYTRLNMWYGQTGQKTNVLNEQLYPGEHCIRENSCIRENHCIRENSCIQENHCMQENSCIQENSCRARKAPVLYHSRISTAHSNELNIPKELSERTLNVPNTRVIMKDVWGNRGIHHSDVTIRNHYAWIKMLHCSPKICKIMRQK